MEEAERFGERIIIRSRAFNCREGMNRKGGCLASADVDSAHSFSAFPGGCMSLRRIGAMLEEHYRLMGWEANGIATTEKVKIPDLEEL